MAEIHPILLAIHTLPHQGRRLLEGKWLFFLDALRNQLLKRGTEANGSNEDLLLFSYTHPADTILALHEILDNLKKEFNWKPDSLGSLPLQFVIHFDKKDEHSATLRDRSASIWDFLRQETIYITRPLKIRWEELLKDRELPPHTVDREGMGLFRLTFSNGNSERTNLFPYRELAVLGKQKECFYCGMTNHLPKACPSKLMGIEMQGINEVGYLPFTELGEIYKEVLANQDKITTALSSGIKPAHIRKKPALLVFFAYFDLFKIYQLRFLHKLAFGFCRKWEDVHTNSTKNLDNRNLHLGLDCLRVGQYDQAEKLFSDELAKREGKHFFATVSLALWALEQQRDNDLQTYLQRAVNLASDETEKIYINLLLARYSLLNGDKWKAEQALDATFNLKQDCEEARYAKIQFQVRTGQGDQTFQELRTLAGMDKQYFMTMLMDPTLLPIHALVEDMLAARLHILNQDAIDNLNKARAGCDELRYWLDENSPDLQENNEAMLGLEKQYERKSYYDLLDVVQHSQAIYYSCHQIRDKKLEELTNRLDRIESQWQGNNHFWKRYPYRSFFGNFAETLEKTSERILLTKQLVARRSGETYRAALKELDILAPDLIALQKVIQRMVWTKLLIDGLRIFVKNILITETIIVTLALISFVAISTLTSGTTDSSLAKIISNHWFQRQATFITTAVFAPFIAMMMTIWEVKNQRPT